MLKIDKLPNLRPGARLVMVGDIHGCVDEFQALLDKVQFRQGLDVLLLVGDLVNKGYDSVGVVRRAKDLGALSVMGNHDATLISQIQRFRSEGSNLSLVDPSDPIAVLASQMPEDCFQYLVALPHIVEVPEFNMIVVHAGLNPTVPDLRDQSLWEILHMRRMMGSRVTDGGNYDPWAKRWQGPETVVFGHDAQTGLQKEKFAIGLDSGCAYGGDLTALVMPGKHFVSVPGSKRGVVRREHAKMVTPGAPAITPPAPRSAASNAGPAAAPAAAPAASAKKSPSNGPQVNKAATAALLAGLTTGGAGGTSGGSPGRQWSPEPQGDGSDMIKSLQSMLAKSGQGQPPQSSSNGANSGKTTPGGHLQALMARFPSDPSVMDASGVPIPVLMTPAPSSSFVDPAIMSSGAPSAQSVSAAPVGYGTQQPYPGANVTPSPHPSPAPQQQAHRTLSMSSAPGAQGGIDVRAALGKLGVRSPGPSTTVSEVSAAVRNGKASPKSDNATLALQMHCLRQATTVAKLPGGAAAAVALVTEGPMDEAREAMLEAAGADTAVIGFVVDAFVRAVPEAGPTGVATGLLDFVQDVAEHHPRALERVDRGQLSAVLRPFAQGANPAVLSPSAARAALVALRP